MSDTATPETGPVDASSVMDSVLAELEQDTGAKPDAIDEVVSELVKTNEGDGQAEEAPEAEGSATEPSDEAKDPEEDSPESEEEEQPEPEDPTYKVKVNGEEVDVPLSELLKGYSRTEDYKAKTMALADERRAVEAERATVEQRVRADYAKELQQSLSLFEALDPILSEARSIDWNRLKAEDPATFVQMSDAVQQRLDLIEQHRGRLTQIEQEQAEREAKQAEAERAERMDRAANKIVEQFPELAEGDAFSKFATDNIGYLREIGFTPEEITEALDERSLILAHEARQWREYQKAKASLPEKKIVQKPAAKALKSDGASSSQPRKRMPANASREQRIAHVLNQFFEE